MDIRDRIINDYFEWMCNLVCGNRYAKSISYRKLLVHLHSTTFTYTIPKDGNRAEDGIDLRRRFIYDYTNDPLAESYLDGPCSVLEMLLALSIRCEDFMDDPRIGNRTGQWFWGMIANLGLKTMTDDRYDKLFVEKIITRFLNRNYAPDGSGGLFTIKNCDQDLRTVEIWYQLCWYLDNFV